MVDLYNNQNGKTVKRSVGIDLSISKLDQNV